jgi:ABC-type uncharacterized transport system auxiliary subunit
VVVLLTTTACGGVLKGIFGDPRPPLERYRLVMPPPPTAPTRNGALPGAVAIAPYTTRGVYDGRGIAYRIDDVRLEPYASREWAIPLRDMLGEATETILKAHPLTTEAAAFDPRLPRTYEYQWRGAVIEFEEVNRGQDVLAAVHLEASLVKTANDSVLWSGSERIERAVPAPTTSMPRVVETLSTLTAEVITRLVDQARAAVQVPTAASAPPPG